MTLTALTSVNPNPAIIATVMTLKPVAGPKLSEIREGVCKAYKVTPTELKSLLRRADIVRARFAYYYAARTLTSHSLPAIGRSLSDRDHNTIWNGVERVKRGEVNLQPEYGRLLSWLGIEGVVR